VKLKAKKENSWLLIKAKDEYATEEDVLLQDKSVISNTTIDSLKS
jgi:bifunctional non-homologous end joining protein LigD